MPKFGKHKPDSEIRKGILVSYSDNDISKLIKAQHHMLASSRSDCMRKAIDYYLKNNNIEDDTGLDVETPFKIPDKISQRYSLYLKGNEPTMLRAIMITLRIATAAECIRTIIKRFIGDNNINISIIDGINLSELYIGLTDKQIARFRTIPINRKYTMLLFKIMACANEKEIRLWAKKGYVRVDDVYTKYNKGSDYVTRVM